MWSPHWVAPIRTEGVPEEQIARWRKGHPLKVSLAARLRAETTVTLDWIAKRLRMGARAHLTHLLYLHEHASSEPPLSVRMVFGGEAFSEIDGQSTGIPEARWKRVALT